MKTEAETPKRILHLTLYRRYFDEIAHGRKKWEYRSASYYWLRRLGGHKFSEVWFHNGYGKDKPFMRVECLKVFYHPYQGRWVIQLGKVLEVKNYENRS